MKKLSIISVVLLCVGCGILWVKGKDMHEIKTEIEINSSPEEVWQVLTDINGWSEWSPIINGSTGEASLGAQVEITMAGKDNKDGPKYSPKVTTFEKPKLFRWRAKMIAEFIFTNDKVFELVETPNGTKLIHKELFRGLMLPLMCSQLDKGVPSMLDSMNKALKEKLEKGA